MAESVSVAHAIDIVCVDTNHSTTDRTASSLERADRRFTVETAVGADAGMRRIRNGSPDCVVSAYRLPGTNGLAFLRAVREEHPELPFILYTDEGSENIASDAITAGVTDYLTRESGQHGRLADRIREAVESRRGERQEELMRLTEFAGDTGGFEVDLDAGRVLTTEGADRLLGLPENEALTLENAVELYHPDDRPAIRQAMNQALETGERTEGTWRYHPPEGEDKLLEVTFVPATTDGDGRMIRGAVHDATEQTRRRRELEQIETLFEHSQDSLFLIDATEAFTLERVNPAYEDATGLCAENICGRTLRDVFGEDGAAMEAKYAECMDRREPLQYDEHIEIDGQLTHWETRIAPVVLGDTVEYVVGSTRNVTKREERRRELGWLRQAIDETDVGITLSDPSLEDNPIVYANDAFEEITGYPSEEILGRNCRYLQGEDTDREKIAALREAIQKEEPITVEIRNYRKDGTEFWNRLTVTPIHDEDGRLVRYLGTQKDITERKKRREELKSERRFIEQALDTLDDLFYVLDTDGTLRRWNDRVPEVTGYGEAELKDRDAITLFPEDERAAMADAMGSIDSAAEMTTEADLLTAGGNRVPYEFTGSRLTDRDGNTTGLVGVGRDLTERRERERRFQALVEESSDVISIVSPDGRFEYLSPSVERILGYSPEELVGDTAWEYIHPEDREQVINTFETWVTDPDRTSGVIEYRSRRADGSWRWMEARGSDQLDDPAVDGLVIVSRDVTERKERQQQLQVFDRVLRHNLRNDMNVIRGEATVIQDASSDEVADRAECIVETTDQLIRTAEEEREISALLRKSPQHRTIAVGPVLCETVSEIRETHPDATISVDCPENTEIRATKRFGHAIEELITNAIVHNDDSSPVVDVTVTETDGTTRIEVADNGPPIPKREQDVLLEPTDRTPVNHTTGLGLWLVKLIASRSGGTLTFDENSPTGNVVGINLQS